MNNKKENIKLLAEKIQRLTTNYALLSKEKANSLFSKIKVFVQNTKVWIENKWNKRDLSFLRDIHFNLHHLVTVCTVGLLAFFVTLYTTGANTSEASAFDESATPKVAFNEKAIRVSYGDHATLGNVVKDILGSKISMVNEPKLVSASSNQCVYAIGDYVSEITILGEKSLGNAKAEIRVEKKSTYFNESTQTIEVSSADKNAAIENGIVCVYTIDLDIVDTEAPKINLDKSEITLDENDTFDAKQYIVNILDNFDGMISEYNIEGEVAKNGDKLKAGNYSLTYRTKDASNNEASATLKVNVEEVEEVVENNASYTSQADSPYAGSIVSEARRLVGSAYVYGGNGPSAFDCSGFVQYVYTRAGIGAPRTSGAQSSFGNAINPNDMSQWRAGDIITFGAGGNEHAAIYSGSGTLIHALNPSQGVMETGVFGSIYAVRRP